MLKYAILGAAAIASLAATAPASAQQVVSNPGYCAQFYPNANCQNRGENSPYNGDYQRRGGTSGPLGYNNGYNNGGYYKNSFNSYNQYDGNRRTDRRRANNNDWNWNRW